MLTPPSLKITQREKYVNTPKLYATVKSEHIQLLHDGKKHWFFSFCFSGHVQKCDSLKNHAGLFTLTSLNVLYRNFKDTSSRKTTLRFQLRCIAIVYAAEILDGKSPIDARFDVPAIRNHLISSLVERDLRPFPKLNQDNP